jgi:ubiquinone/menaquinone biosynthesis C-methylase UbiE
MVHHIQLVVEMNPSAKFWDKIAKRYSKRPVADEASYQEKLRVTRTYFRPDTEVLEFGCGTGSTAISHSPYVRHIHAIDISSKMIEIAQEKADEGKVPNVTFEQSTIEGVSVPDQSLDAVLGLSILHLLENKEGAIEKVHRMLKPGGVFVTSTTCLGDSMKFFKLIAPIGKLFGLMPLLKVFTTGELLASLTDAGFEIDHQWQPGKGKAVFIVAKKAE